MFAPLLNPLMILLSLSTASGVLMHDTKIDKAAASALSLPAVLATYESNTKSLGVTSDLHVHAERSAFVKAITNFNTSPATRPRVYDEKKQFQPRFSVGGHHAFDNYNLPIV